MSLCDRLYDLLAAKANNICIVNSFCYIDEGLIIVDPIFL